MASTGEMVYDFVRFTIADIHGISRGKTTGKRAVNTFDLNAFLFRLFIEFINERTGLKAENKYVYSCFLCSLLKVVEEAIVLSERQMIEEHFGIEHGFAGFRIEQEELHFYSR